MQNELTAELVDAAIHYLTPIYESAGLDGYKRNLGTALAALRAEQERNKGCGWCSYFKEEIRYYYVSEYGDDRQYYKICPMCGRRLTEGGENDDNE